MPLQRTTFPKKKSLKPSLNLPWKKWRKKHRKCQQNKWLSSQRKKLVVHLARCFVVVPVWTHKPTTTTVASAAPNAKGDLLAKQVCVSVRMPTKHFAMANA
jgi:hypothetical protein